MSELDRKEVLAKIRLCKHEREAMEFIYVNGLARDQQLLMRYWQNVGVISGPPEFSLPNFTRSDALGLALEELTTSRQALMVLGESGWGKTQYMMTWFKDYETIRVSHMDDLKRVSPRTHAIILDDLGLGHLPRTTLLHLLDVKTDRSVHVRYSTARLHRNLCVVIVANSLALAIGDWMDDEAVMRRIQVLVLGQSLIPN